MTVTAFEMHVPGKGPAHAFLPLERELPKPAADEVRVAIEAAGVAYVDIAVRKGLYSSAKPPVTPGYDFVGRIEELGSGVTEFTVGQRVAGVTISGSYATHRNVGIRFIVPAPEHADAGQLVAATLNGVTAWQIFHRLANADPGEWVLVHGAAGGVGSILLDLARLSGVKAIGSASAGKSSVISSRGAVPIDYQKDNVLKRTREISDGGVAAAFDHLGGRHLTNVSMPSLRPGGTTVLYGGYNTTRNGKFNPLATIDFLTGGRFSGFNLFKKSLGVSTYTVVAWMNARNSAYRKDLEEVLSLVGEGTISPLVGATFPLREVPEAHRALEARSIAGKIVLKVS